MTPVTPLVTVLVISENYPTFTISSFHLAAEEPFLSVNPYEVDTCLFTPSSVFSSTLRDVLTGRPTIAQYPNFIRGFQLHNKYLESKGFSTWKGTVNQHVFQQYSKKV